MIIMIELFLCAVVNCGRPTEPQHGAVQWTNFGYSYTATYSCDPGHVLEGAREVTCQANGRWSSGPPTCRGATYWLAIGDPLA